MRCLSQGLNASEIIERLGEDDKTVESKLKFLSENGLVERDEGSNKWKITDLGKIQLAEIKITSLG